MFCWNFIKNEITTFFKDKLGNVLVCTYYRHFKTLQNFIFLSTTLHSLIATFLGHKTSKMQYYNFQGIRRRRYFCAETSIPTSFTVLTFMHNYLLTYASLPVQFLNSTVNSRQIENLATLVCFLE